MRKLSNINEGVIGDIIKRATTDEVRVEDEYNLDTIWKRLSSTYRLKDNVDKSELSDYEIEFGRDGNSICVPLSTIYPLGTYIMLVIEIDRNGELLYILDNTEHKDIIDKDLLKTIRANKFDIEFDDSCEYYIIKGINNYKSLISFIDIVLEKSRVSVLKKSNSLNEGAIGDIIKRAASDDVRQEDIIDKMTPDEFLEYINANYSSKSLRKPYKSISKQTENIYINIPIIKINDPGIVQFTTYLDAKVGFKDNLFWFIRLDKDARIIEYTKFWEPYLGKFKKSIKNENFYIKPQTGNMTLTKFVEYLDYTIENNPYSNIEKKK